MRELTALEILCISGGNSTSDDDIPEIIITASTEASGNSQMCSATQPYGFQQFSTLTSVGVNSEQPLDKLPLFGFPGSLARAMYRTVAKTIF